MSDRPGPFDRLDEETEQDIERYEINKIVDDLVKEALDIIRDEDNHGSIGGHGSRVAPASIDSIMDEISIPSKEVDSEELSEVLSFISNFEYQREDTGSLIAELKGNVSSALLMKLNESYPKHWEVRLGGQTFHRLFNNVSGVDSLHVADCSGTLIGAGINNVESICFEDIDSPSDRRAGIEIGEGLESVGTAVFKNIDGRSGVDSKIETALFFDVNRAEYPDVVNAILHDVTVESIPKPHSIQVDNDRPQTAYIRSDPSSKDGDRLTTILYDAYAGVLVSQNAAETVRPLTDEEHRVIEELADGPPPDKQEVTDAIATLNKEADNDG